MTDSEITAEANGHTLVLTPMKEGVRADGATELELLIRFQAPDAPPIGEGEKERPALDLALVLDRSGSMCGEPLAEAKRCAEMIVRQLLPRDRVAVVDFGSDVSIPVRFASVEDRDSVADAIGRIECHGATALHEGWLTGAEQLAEGVTADRVTRILLLSDGCANAGLTDPSIIADQARQLRAAGISTSTYGLGSHFDEDLMNAMAEAGGGSPYYGQTAQDLMEPFLEEFELLAALSARQVRVFIESADGVSFAALNARADAEGALELPDVAYDGETWALIRLDIPELRSDIGGGPLLKLWVEAKDLDGASFTVGPIIFRPPALPSEAFDNQPDDPLVAKRLREVESAGLQTRAAAAADAGDFLGAANLLDEAIFQAQDDENVVASLRASRDMLARREVRAMRKEVLAKSYKLRSKLAPKVREADSRPISEIERASYLRRKGVEGVARDSGADLWARLSANEPPNSAPEASTGGAGADHQHAPPESGGQSQSPDPDDSPVKRLVREFQQGASGSPRRSLAQGARSSRRVPRPPVDRQS